MNERKRSNSDNEVNVNPAVVDFVENWKAGFWENEPAEKPAIHNIRLTLQALKRDQSSPGQ